MRPNPRAPPRRCASSASSAASAGTVSTTARGNAAAGRLLERLGAGARRARRRSPISPSTSAVALPRPVPAPVMIATRRVISSSSGPAPQREVSPPLLSPFVLELVAAPCSRYARCWRSSALGVELHAEARAGGDFEAALERERLRDHLAVLLGQVRVDRVADHRLRRGQLHDRRRRDAELAVGVQAEPEVERLDVVRVEDADADARLDRPRLVRVDPDVPDDRSPPSSRMRAPCPPRAADRARRSSASRRGSRGDRRRGRADVDDLHRRTTSFSGISRAATASSRPWR